MAACSAPARDGGAPTGPVSEPAPVDSTPAEVGAKDTVWTVCVTAGNVCQYLGLRDVRLGAASGPYVQQTAFHGVPCAVYGFGDRDPAPDQPLHCDIGPLKTIALVNPAPGMAGMGDRVTVPLGSPGSSEERIEPTVEEPVGSDEPGAPGAFRTTCSLASYGFFDPIVFPGQTGSSHLHIFFGNTAVGPGSTPETLVASGASTCRGGRLNRTAYWAPAVFDARTSTAVTPDEAIFYYKGGYNTSATDIQPFPAGLRMIAGDKRSLAAQPYVVWSCGELPTGDGGSIPGVCPAGEKVRLSITFPQCWDGTHLDTPDHQSHMAYPDYRNDPARTTCPTTHPVMLPEITEHFDFPVRVANESAHWRLSSDMYDQAMPGGFSAHADWMNGWDPATMRTIVTQCLNKALDCGVASIGDGRALY
jgi:hypothetical protein